MKEGLTMKTYEVPNVSKRKPNRRILAKIKKNEEQNVYIKIKKRSDRLVSLFSK